MEADAICKLVVARDWRLLAWMVPNLVESNEGGRTVGLAGLRKPKQEGKGQCAVVVNLMFLVDST